MDSEQDAAVVFLTRKGCVNTPLLLSNLKAAIDTFVPGLRYHVLDQASLPAVDTRKGYPTPTILVGTRDLFGMVEPTPPFPEPR